AQVAGRDAMKVRARIPRRLLQIGKCFFLNGHDGHVVTEAPGAAQHEERESAVPGYEADSAHAETGILSGVTNKSLFLRPAAAVLRRIMEGANPSSACPPKPWRRRTRSEVQGEEMRRLIPGILLLAVLGTAAGCNN